MQIKNDIKKNLAVVMSSVVKRVDCEINFHVSDVPK